MNADGDSTSGGVGCPVRNACDIQAPIIQKSSEAIRRRQLSSVVFFVATDEMLLLRLHATQPRVRCRLTNNVCSIGF